ncbi:MAG TPA: L-rhamnose/proton symporter RhaT [Candidatus Hydrogenedentes bacterium]|nr:L-rhamnose/proton symporter RhaT [Candidatus Hydrogenedentota bacterium]HPG65959.1 L-rhamnose/proton symporter RhaT [Candidatus Hydrogenedentota bacterium]
MSANPFLGIMLHALGGFAAASFYLPFKGVRKWAWESYWLVGGFFSWIVAPLVAAAILNPHLFKILAGAPARALFWTYLFGVLWGIGGLTFGLAMRYLGLSLGYALALGFCAAFGTIIPPVFSGTFVDLMTHASGLTVLAGVGVCLAGIAVCGKAGILKERQLTEEQKAETVREFSFIKGLWIAVFAGVMSACMAFAFKAGESIGERAAEMGTSSTFCKTPVLVVALLGGFTTNGIWCLFLNVKNGTIRDYVRAQDASLIANYALSAMAGVTWYLQFFFYGMGTTKMGRYDFSSWTIHMAFIIVFSNIWGILSREWRGTNRKTHGLIVAGIVVLLLSTVVVGLGNYLDAR